MSCNNNQNQFVDCDNLGNGTEYIFRSRLMILHHTSIHRKFTLFTPKQGFEFLVVIGLLGCGGRLEEMWEEVLEVWGMCRKMCWSMERQHTFSHTFPYISLDLLPRDVGGRLGETWGEVWGMFREVCWGVEPQHISSHTSSYISSNLLPQPNTLLYTYPHTSPHFPSPSLSVTKLPLDEVSVAKFLASLEISHWLKAGLHNQLSSAEPLFVSL